MSDAKKPASGQSFEERKKALIARGAEQRRNIDASIVIVRENLHPDVLAKSALHHVTAKARDSVDKLLGRGHHADKVDLSGDLTGGAYGAYDDQGGIPGLIAKFNHLTNGNHAAGRLIGTVRRMLPLASTALGILRRRQLMKPVLKGAAVLGGVGAGAYAIYRYKQRDQAAQADDDALPYAYYPEPARPAVLDSQGHLH